MNDKIIPLTEAVEGYELFDKAKVQKGIILPQGNDLSRNKEALTASSDL